MTIIGKSHYMARFQDYFLEAAQNIFAPKFNELLDKFNTEITSIEVSDNHNRGMQIRFLAPFKISYNVELTLYFGISISTLGSGYKKAEELYIYGNRGVLAPFKGKARTAMYDGVVKFRDHSVDEIESYVPVVQENTNQMKDIERIMKDADTLFEKLIEAYEFTIKYEVSRGNEYIIKELPEIRELFIF